MRKGLTEVVFILDKSGSMQGMEKDTIGGFNSMLEKQKAEEGEALISTVLFSNGTEVLHDRISVNKVEPLTEKDYTTDGGTALLDAIGGAIHHIKKIHKNASEDEVPEHTIFIITTDGEENSSRIYSYEKIKKMVKKQQEKHGWEFLFLGANIDSFSHAEMIGIGKERTANFNCDAIGSRVLFSTVSESVSGLRNRGKIAKGWSEEIDRDYKKRG